MMKIITALCCLAIVASGYSLGGGGPSNPLIGNACTQEGMMAADDNNMCWFYKCVHNANGGLQWLPRRCAWMSKVSDFFTTGMYNPCTINLGVGSYLSSSNPCRRQNPAMVGPPSCASNTQCFNGGTAVFEANICWCVCPETWQGNFDCSLPTMKSNGLPPQSNICINGAPEQNWCDMAGGCLNGGTCFNQCQDFWCDCGEVSALSVDHIGKRCEVTSDSKSVY